MEDLWAFNDEGVARAIAACPVPVIAGIGHETDTTLADFVADLRAPTPSAAAELVVARKREFGDRITRLRDRLTAATRSGLERSRSRVHHATSRPAMAGWPARLALRGRHAAELTHDLRRVGRTVLGRHGRVYRDLARRLDRCDLRHRVALWRSRVHRVDATLGAAMLAIHTRHTARLGTLAGRLGNLSPLAVLGRGYALCWDQARARLIRDAAVVSPGDTVRGHPEPRRTHMRGDRPLADTIRRTAMTDPSIKDFESAIGELESIVKTLEDGELPLEKSLELFERGVELSRFCHSRLEAAERRIEVLDERGNLQPAPEALDPGESSSELGR